MRWGRCQERILFNFLRICLQCRFYPWVGKIPWRREWLPTLVCLENSMDRSLKGYSPWGHRVGHNWATNTFTFKFYIGVELINNVVIVSGGQQRDSAIHTYVSILPQTPLPSRLSHNIEQSSLSYMVGPHWLFILNIAVCTCPFQTL